MAAAKLGITSDPNPNPVGLGILAMLSFWPSLIIMALGLIEIYRNRKSKDV